MQQYASVSSLSPLFFSPSISAKFPYLHWRNTGAKNWIWLTHTRTKMDEDREVIAGNYPRRCTQWQTHVHTPTQHGAMCIKLIEWVSKKGVSQKQEESEKGSDCRSISLANLLTKVSLCSFHSTPTSLSPLKISCLTYHLNIYQTQKHWAKSLTEQTNEWRQFFSPDTSPKVKMSVLTVRQLKSFPVNLTQTNSLRMGATSSVQWRTMHVCRSAAKRKQRRHREVQSSGCCSHGTGERRGRKGGLAIG